MWILKDPNDIEGEREGGANLADAQNSKCLALKAATSAPLKSCCLSLAHESPNASTLKNYDLEEACSIAITQETHFVFGGAGCLFIARKPFDYASALGRRP